MEEKQNYKILASNHIKKQQELEAQRAKLEVDLNVNTGHIEGLKQKL